MVDKGRPSAGAMKAKKAHPEGRAAGAKAPSTPRWLERIAKARSEITFAEGELEAALDEIKVLPRAEKTTVSKVVGDAFDKLRAAKSNLVDLEGALKKDRKK
jgi:hypothetical protein